MSLTDPVVGQRTFLSPFTPGVLLTLAIDPLCQRCEVFVICFTTNDANVSMLKLCGRIAILMRKQKLIAKRGYIEARR